MIIIHKIDDFLFSLFSKNSSERSIESLKNEIEDYYSYGPFKPTVTIENDIVKIDIEVNKIFNNKKDYDRVVALCQSGKFNDAKPILEKLIKENPTNSEFYRLFGQIQSEQGNQTLAVNYLIDALRWDPRNNFALIMMGNIYAKYKNDIDTALRYYKQVIVNNPTDNIALNNIGVNLMQSNRIDEAVIYFEKAYAINPKYPNTIYALAMVAQIKGDLLKAFEKSIECIKKAQVSTPIHGQAMKLAVDISQELSKSGRGELVFEEYKSALEKRAGTKVVSTNDQSIPTAAKLEFAENYGRDFHQIKYKSNYPNVEHLKMHELVHLDFVIQAREQKINKLFTSNNAHKETFIRDNKETIYKLNRLGISENNISNYISGLFDGLNRQIYNAPIDLFIEQFLFETFPSLRPYQFLSLNQIVGEGIASVTDKRVLEISPKETLRASKILNIVTALQYKELYGVDLIPKLKATPIEMRSANDCYSEYKEYVQDRAPAEEYELVQHWGEDLKLDKYFALVDEVEYRKVNEVKKVETFEETIDRIESDPFDLEKPDKPQDPLSFKKEPAGQMAVMFYCLAALQYFESKSIEKIQEIGFEIGMMGRAGINPRGNESYALSSVPDKSFTGLQMLAWMYVAFQKIDPSLDTGLDFKEDYQRALMMHNNK